MVLRLDFSALRTAHQRWPETHPGTLLYQMSTAWAQILQPHQAHWPCSAEVKGGEDPETIKAPKEPPPRKVLRQKHRVLSPTHPAA